MSVDSIEREKNKNKNKVVAQVPKVGVTTWIPPNPDKNWAAVAKANNMPQGYITATSDPTGSRNKAYLDSFNVDQPAPQVGAVDPFGPGGLEGLISSIRGSGGGSSTAAADGLARDKWNAQQASDAATSAASLRALQGMQGRLASGGYRGNADTLLGLIDTQNQQGQTAIQGQYDTGTGNINAGYDTGLGMINSGYGDLNKYLNANQIDPYANLQQQVSPVNNAMADYLSAYGVSNDPVNQQVQASQMANQEGANSFNQLQQLMSANQLSNNQSNLGVSQAAQNYATTGLGTQRAGYLANAESARMSAMNQLMDQIDQARYGVEEGVGNRKNALEEAIIGAGGDIGAGPDDVNPDTGRVDAPPVATTRAQKVADAPNKYGSFKEALKDMSPNYKFTTMAAAKKAFKPLAAAFKK